MDEAYRKAQRAAHKGDPGAQVRFLLMRRRAGEITDDQLWVAGLLGDEAAAGIIGINGAHVAKTVPEMLANWRLLSTDNHWQLYAAAMRTLRNRLSQILSDEAEQLRSRAYLESLPTRLWLLEAANSMQAGADDLQGDMFQQAVVARMVESPIVIRFDTLIEESITRIWHQVGAGIVSIPIQERHRARVTQELQQLAIQRVYAGLGQQYCRC